MMVICNQASISSSIRLGSKCIGLITLTL